MTVPLDIFSDPICPWCYIGKTRLDRAIAAHEAKGGVSPFTVTWRPFQLNPDMPSEGMDRADYLARKFGGEDGAKRVYARIEETARGDGLDIAFEKIARTPNTLDAHRLLRWAATEGLQGPVADALFERYFRRGEDISDHGVLTEIADEAGMERAVVARLLEGDADLQAVRNEDVAAREAGFSGVPTFLINARHVVPGAIDQEMWAKVIAELDQMIAEAQAQPPEG